MKIGRLFYLFTAVATLFTAVTPFLIASWASGGDTPWWANVIGSLWAIPVILCWIVVIFRIEETVGYWQRAHSAVAEQRDALLEQLDAHSS